MWPLGEMGLSETKIPNPERTQWEGSGVRLLLYPTETFSLGPFKVMGKGVGGGAGGTQYPQGALRQAWWRALWRALFRTK